MVRSRAFCGQFDRTWDEEVCAENNRFIGSVSVDGKVTKIVAIPTADHPDF